MISCPVRIRTRFCLDEEIKRKLQGKAKVLVKRGQQVDPQKMIARLEIGGEPLVFDLPRLLKAKKPFTEKHLLKKPGEKVKKGDRLACLQSFLFGKRILIAPRSGEIKELKESSGELVFLPETRQEVAVPSLFWGEVVKAGKEEAVIKSQFLDVFGVSGSGQALGKLILCRAGESRFSFPDQEDLESGILVFQDSPGRASLEKLKICGAAGVICGGLHWRDFSGCQRRDLALLITEGLGKLRIGQDLWEVLQEYEGRPVFLEGEKKRLRIPLEKKEARRGEKEAARERELKKGDQVRLVGEPGPIGAQGKVVEIEAKKTRVESGFKTVLVKVKTDTDLLKVPAANLEIAVASRRSR